MKLINNFIPCVYFKQIKIAFTIPQQMITEQIYIYEEALPYIECEIRNTIRHEAEHRSDEEQGRPGGMSFEEWSSEGRVEPIAEKSETEACEALQPPEVSSVIPVNVDEVFQRAKNESGINPSYLQDVKAAILPDDILGLYGMQDRPENATNVGMGWDGSQYINVAAFFKPWIAEQDKHTFPPNVQDDGIVTDPDALKSPNRVVPHIPPAPSGYPSQSIPTWSPVPGVIAR